MTAAIDWYGFADITHMNVRKCGPDEEKTLTLDLKLVAECKSDVLGFFDDSLATFLFFPDGSLRMPMMEPVSWAGEVRHMRLEVAEIEFSDVTLRKFAFAPAENFNVAMTFTATLAPEKAEIAMLAEFLGESAKLVIEPEGDLFGDVDKSTGEISKPVKKAAVQEEMRIE